MTFKVAKEPNFLDATVTTATLTASPEEDGFSGNSIGNKLLGKRFRFQPMWVVMSSGAHQNNKLDFDEGAGELNAAITTGTYKDTEMCTAIQGAMNTAGSANTYTCTYDVGTGKFTIKGDTVVYTIKWNTGANASTSVGADIGADVSADQTATGSAPNFDCVMANTAENMGHFIKANFATTQKITLLAMIGGRFGEIDGDSTNLTDIPAAMQLVHYTHSSDLGDYWELWEATATKNRTISLAGLSTAPDNELFVDHSTTATAATWHYFSFQESLSPTNNEGMYPWLEFSYMFAGDVYDLDTNSRLYAADHTRTSVEPVVRVVTQANSENSSALPRHTRLVLPLDHWPTADWQRLYSLYREVGRINAAVWLLTPDLNGSQNDGLSSYFATIDTNLEFGMTVNDSATAELTLRQQRTDDGR